MALHLNWDGNQNNGIIFNNTYTNGALFTGVTNKPVLSFAFDSFQYSEVFAQQLNFVELAGTKKVMSVAEETEIQTIATNWVQPLGQEGNPTLVQAKEMKKNYLRNSFNKDVQAITTALPHEMASWAKQENEARAWTVDNTVLTPFIDALIVSRNLVETKQGLVTKIIASADAYQTAYITLLGKYQNLMNNIDIATMLDLNNIVW